MPTRRGERRSFETDSHAIGFLLHPVAGGVEFVAEPWRLRSGGGPQTRRPLVGRSSQGRLARLAHGAITDGKHVAPAKRPPAYSGHQVHRRAAHNQRDIQSAPHREGPKRKTSPLRISTGCHVGTGELNSEPVTEITTLPSKANSPPVKVISSAGAFAAVPTSRWPARSANGSAAPDAEIPKCA